MPIISYIGSTSGTSTAQNFLLAAPTGAKEGDLVLLAVYGGSSHVPSGWTLASAEQTPAPTTRQTISWKVLTAADMAAWPLSVATGGDSVAWVASAYRNAESVDAVAAWSGSGTTEAFTPSAAVGEGESLVVGIIGGTRPTLPPLPSGYTSRTTTQKVDPSYRAMRMGDQLGTPPQYGGGSVNVEQGDWIGHTVVLDPVNVAPNAPTLDVPASVDRNVTNRFNLTPSDPNPGDSTSQTDWRYREIGAATWTTVTKVSPNTFYDFAAGTFLGTDYEIQARTYDARGTVGPYSTSSFFTAGDAPDQPTWTDPINGQTIATESYTGTISAPSVDESEWRLVADNAGVIDETTVLQGPVVKTTGDLRSHTFTGLANGVTVWWQARTKFAGLWSQWAAVRTPVSYTPPAAPTVTLSDDDASGSLWVNITNPTPGAGEPTAEYNSVEVDDGDGWERRATFLATNTGWRYWTPISGRDYSGNVRVVAHGDNGTTATTTVPAGTAPVEGFYYGGGY